MTKEHRTATAMRNIVRQILERLPAAVGPLTPRAYVERYPSTYNFVTGQRDIPGAVFAYQFFSMEGRNVATWMPCTGDTPLMQTDNPLSPCGRPWSIPLPLHFVQLDL